jgi:hypothetical protein
MGVRKDQWPIYYAEVFRIIKPGGYVQTCEIDHFEIRENVLGSVIAKVLSSAFGELTLSLSII